MKKTIFTIGLSVALAAGAAELKQFDPSVLGQSITSTVKLMSDEPGDILPASIQVDLKDGNIVAATVSYHGLMKLAEAKASLNKLYGKWQRSDQTNNTQITLWRNEEKGFVMQLTKEGHEVIIRYVSFKKAVKS